MKDMKKIALFGATGSIGRQSIDVIDRLGGFKVTVLAARSKWQTLAEAALHLRPEIVAIENTDAAVNLQNALFGKGIKILAGSDAAAEAAAEADFDVCLNGLVGTAGLMPSYLSLKRGKYLALANKESLVLAGEILNRIVRETSALILPVDSEHSAILQCLQGENKSAIKRLILTASGGPFRETPLDEVRNATAEQALRHPTWKMGPKITIDSATLMNKGLEVIEACHLFGVGADRIEVRIHPVSIVHSMVEFVDGSFKAQLGKPDMRLPIQYALTYPDRRPLDIHPDDPADWNELRFYNVDLERYPCLKLAYQVLERGGTAPAVLNGADEAAVEAFIEGKIRFGDISSLVAQVLEFHEVKPADSIEEILKADQWGRDTAAQLISERYTS